MKEARTQSIIQHTVNANYSLRCILNNPVSDNLASQNRCAHKRKLPLYTTTERTVHSTTSTHKAYITRCPVTELSKPPKVRHKFHQRITLTTTTVIEKIFPQHPLKFFKKVSAEQRHPRKNKSVWAVTGHENLPLTAIFAANAISRVDAATSFARGAHFIVAACLHEIVNLPNFFNCNSPILPNLKQLDNCWA